MSDLISRQAAIDAIDVLCQEHRYKIPGKGETYSQYNEAWQDALDRAEGAIFNLPPSEPEKRTGERTETHACDSISRQAAIDAVREYPNDLISQLTAIEDLPSAQPTQSNASNTLNALDCISRQAAIAAINQICPIETEYGFALLDRVDVRCVLTELPSAQPEQRWISCSERLPKAFEYCLWTTTDGKVVYHYCDGQFSKYIAWMPLPEPYQEERENNGASWIMPTEDTMR